MFFWRGFARLRGRKIAHCQFTKVHQWNPSESRHWSFPSNEQMKKLSVRQRWARTGREQQSRTTTKDDLVLPRSIFCRWGRGNQRQLPPTILYLRKIHEGVEYFEPNRSRLESLPRKSWRYFVSLTLKLASNQLHASSSNWCPFSHSKLKGTMIRVLVENNFDRDNVCHMAIEVFLSTFTTAMCKCTIIALLDDSNLNAFQTFWPRMNILRLVDVPKFIDDCNFRSADSRVSLSNFSFN